MVAGVTPVRQAREMQRGPRTELKQGFVPAADHDRRLVPGHGVLHPSLDAPYKLLIIRDREFPRAVSIELSRCGQFPPSSRCLHPGETALPGSLGPCKRTPRRL